MANAAGHLLCLHKNRLSSFPSRHILCFLWAQNLLLEQGTGEPVYTYGPYRFMPSLQMATPVHVDLPGVSAKALPLGLSSSSPP